MTSPARTHAKALNLLAFATLFWGLSFPVMKTLGQLQQQLLPDTSSWFGTALVNTVRFTGAAALMALFSFRTLHRITRAEIWQGLGLGFFGGIGLIFQMDGLNYTEASTSAFLTQAYCIVLPVVAAVREKRPPPLKLLFASALVIIGITILTGVNPARLKVGRGEAETLVGSMIFIGQILWLDRPGFRSNHVGHFSLVMFVVTALLGAAAMVVTMRQPADTLILLQSHPVQILVGILILFCTMIAYLMMNYWQPKISASEAGLVYCAEPVFASLFALCLPGIFSRWFGVDYPNEILTPRLFWGGGLILGANMLLQIEIPPKNREP